MSTLSAVCGLYAPGDGVTNLNRNHCYYLELSFNHIIIIWRSLFVILYFFIIGTIIITSCSFCHSLLLQLLSPYVQAGSCGFVFPLQIFLQIRTRNDKIRNFILSLIMALTISWSTFEVSPDVL